MPNAQPPTIDDTITAFLRTLSGANKSPSTITAYRTDLAQFARFLAETTCTVAAPVDITRADVSEFLGHLADRRLSDVTRARKQAALREWFRCLEGEALITKNPTMESPTSTPRTSRSPTSDRPDWDRAIGGFSRVLLVAHTDNHVDGPAGGPRQLLQSAPRRGTHTQNSP